MTTSYFWELKSVWQIPTRTLLSQAQSVLLLYSNSLVWIYAHLCELEFVTYAMIIFLNVMNNLDLKKDF